ncbi:bifunctional folylpolyglutamate synthase/dihydrofolate synthase [Adlercreutzia equolifaciens]|uniref:bifunctional folylpolyglutamate synthase/dihydrofolate synthase n=1 Tax=Adlercreutzia equolifaciens TaxID=446660 RepID=UPI0023AF7825|nr:folylpolyglutamate synthase/dihydrofolate synthase family protein [Adlercreutzia equolifaciens]MDE8702231.1 bifunctional folylpolyglutamate synthase/dihydrofolate synthase [Adlercreutzia equolifaciens]
MMREKGAVVSDDGSLSEGTGAGGSASASAGDQMPIDPVAWINTPRWQASRLGLDRMVALLEELGRPQDDLRFVHVAGTNGKGSTCAYLASILQAAGYRVGLFTSPFIECFEERIRVNGANITTEELSRAVAAVRPCAEAVEKRTGDHPTEFELMAAVAFEHFRSSGCDVVVLEVGLGGRLDATNVIETPEVSVIARIGLDHTDLLGDTLAAVAGEKAGIIKPGVPVVSWPQDEEAMAVVERVCAERGCALTTPDFASLHVEPLEWGKRGDAAEFSELRCFSYQGEEFVTRLLGSYQPANAALALETVRVLVERGWDIPAEAQFAGVAAAQWPGRFEVVASDPLTIIDGGHNPQGAQALAASLADALGEEGFGSVTFVMGVLADKDYGAMAAAIAPWARRVVTYTPDSPRALPGGELAAYLQEACELEASAVPTPAEAMARARALAASEADAGIVVAFGTLYAIVDLKQGLS